MDDFQTIRFLTCGHVDDGKSTLIGRLLHDIGVVPDDQIEAAKDASGHIDFSLFTDGLEDERRQGITIDVAYRYFRHEGYRYRIADTPGHLEYMRNMAVAAIDCDLAVILVDAIHGVRLQTVQYSKIARFFGVKRFIVCVNKMDAVDYSENRFHAVCEAYAQSLGEAITQYDISYLPVSALQGDNIITLSPATAWYQGQPLLSLLQQVPLRPVTHQPLCLPIQQVVKDASGKRWYLGTLRGGTLKIGDVVVSAHSGQKATVNGLYHSGHEVSIAKEWQAVAIRVDEDVDLSRGAVLSHADLPMLVADSFYADVLWLDKAYEAQEHFQGTIKLHHEEEQAQVTIEAGGDALKRAFVCLARPAAMEPFSRLPAMGLFLLIDAYSERAVGVGTIRDVVLPMSAEAIAI